MQKPIPKKLICLSLVIVVFLGLFLINVGEARASFWSWALGGLKPVALDILRGVFTVLLHVAQAFAGFIGNIFSLIVNFGFQDMEMVEKGWTMCRDIVNMFFILGLVVIAFATILKIETHGIKALLPKFIIIALLINFSYLVCGLIIDATQIAANYFAELIGENIDIGLVVLHRLNVTQSMGGGGGVIVPISDQDPDLIMVTTMIFDTFVLFIVGFVLLVGAILLFIRVGALWALIILSPFAWFFSIFPGKLKSYANQWWEAFLKWAFFAPIYIFFIYLILRISKEEIISKLGQAYGGNIPSAPAGLSALTMSPMFQNLHMLFNFIFLTVLLFGAPTIAMSMGIKGAGAAQSFVKGAFRGTAKLAYKLPGKLRGAMIAPPGWMKAIPGVRRVTAGISTVARWTTPAFWKQAYEERKKERLREARVGYTVGKMQDFQTRVLSVFTRKTKHAEESEQFEIDEESQKIALETNRESSQLLAVLRNAVKGKDKIRASATLKLLFDQNDHNDLQLDEEFSEWKWTEKSQTAKEENLVDKAYGQATDQAGLKDLLFQMYAKMGVSESKAAPVIGNLSHTALASGNYGAYHMTHTDTEGREGRSTDEDQKKIAATKAATVNVRVKTRTEHPTNIIKEGWDKQKKEYTYKGIDRFGLYQLKQLTQTEINERRYGEGRPDYLKLVPEALKDLDEAIRKADEQEIERARAEERDAKLWTEDEKLRARTFLENTAKGTPTKAKKAAEEGAKKGAKKPMPPGVTTA